MIPAAGVWAIRDRAAFADLRRRGRRCRSGPLAVVWVPGPDTCPPRVAYAVGRQVGSAVTRNRVRRQLREAAGALAASGALAPGDYLVVASPDAGDSDFATLRSGLGAACAKLTERSGQ